MEEERQDIVEHGTQHEAQKRIFSNHDSNNYNVIICLKLHWDNTLEPLYSNRTDRKYFDKAN